MSNYSEFPEAQKALLVLTISNTEVKSLSRTLENVAVISADTGAFSISSRVILSEDSLEAKATVQSYANKLDVSIISTSDRGISDALNIGLQYAEDYAASYDYFLFLHAGDIFSEPSQAATVFNQILSYGSDPYSSHYGTIKKGNSLQKSYPFNISTISGINHWGLVQSISTARLARFNLKYKVAMDYDYILCLMRKGVVFREYDQVLVYADPDGLSKSYNWQIKKDLNSIYFNHFYQEGYVYKILQASRSLKRILKGLIRIFLP